MELKSPSELPPREMEPADRRRIFRELEEVYDETNGRYRSGWTDKTLADKISVPRAWVEKVRDENFGPSGHNLEMEQLETAIAKAISDCRNLIETMLAGAAEAEKRINALEGLRDDLDRIRRAVGPKAAK